MKSKAHWLEVLDPGESLDMLRDLAYSHATEAGPYASILKDMIHKCRFRDLCEFEVDYHLEGLTANAVMHTRQALAFFQKLRYLEIGINKEEAGLRTFFESETLNCESNNRFILRRKGLLAFPARVEEAFASARQKIRRVLKEVPPLESLKLRFGPGSTRKTRKADASTRAKCAEGVTCSEELFPAAFAVLRELPSFSSENADLSWIDEDGDEWDLTSIEIIASKLSFAFKNAKTFRLIGIEALLNLIVQLGYGTDMAQKLAAFGVDIRRQEPNQLAAKMGSLTGEIATLDLKSASDTNCTELVYELFPLDWACALNRCRSAWIELPDGSLLRQAKFSAMGNGFTFPLETLIFWALTVAVVKDPSAVCVYGDDIVVPTKHFDSVSEVLRYAGFNVNPEKSYKSSPFRESCGKDFFGGIDVRPFYQKEWISGQSLFVLHNWYVRHGDFERAKYVMNLIHPSLLIYGPDGYGDGHLIGDHARNRTPSQERNGYGGYFFESFTTKSRREVRSELTTLRGDYPAALYTIYMRGESSPGLPVKEPGVNDDFWSTLYRHTLAYEVDRQLVCPGTPIPETSREEGLKSWPLPGFDGYKKIKIYNLGA